MKWSIYIACFEFDNSVMLYKSITDALFEVSRNEYRMINQFLENGDSKQLSDSIKSHISELYLNKFIVENEVDEVELFKHEYLKKITEAQAGTVYFSPSFLCNLKCTYCIIGESVNNSRCETRMRGHIVDKSAEYVYKTAVNRNIKQLNVILYGGEPMLSQASNISFIKKLAELNQEQKVSIEYTLVTNGYDMSDGAVNEILNAGVLNLQITLDGPRHIHDTRRIGVHGEKTFDIILEHLCTNSLKFKNVVIRINVDNTNAGSICELINILGSKELNKHCLLHLNLVDPSDYSNASGYNEETISRFDEIYKYAYSKGFRVAPWRRFCSIASKMYLAIDPQGNIYNCPNYMGIPKKVIGNVGNMISEDHVRINLNERCTACCYVGICNGGCQVMRQTSDIGADYCFKRVNYQMTKSYFGAKYHRFTIKSNNLVEEKEE